MLCSEFEDRLTDYLDGALDAATNRDFAAHALRCPVCHELLSEVKNAVIECRTATTPPPSPTLEARILQQIAPETAMSCDDFEQYLTDYLDGFLPAPLFHRWERHATLCQRCTELPGEVVRSIGACYSYISEERVVPEGLHERILQATLGTTRVGEVRAPLSSRIVEWMRGWLDVVVSPQLATVATMVLLAVFVGTNTLSDDGSISGMYRASLRLAAQTYEHGAKQANELRQVTEGLENIVVAPAESGAAEMKVEPAQKQNQSAPVQEQTPEQKQH